ncbi:MAG: hypothetical protein A2289_08000 [Deltaproteobacteria bacterium RIFOXYA12_FULL_58_15]|nr:MAG: hypothetical protein A2289_08000 [Deltaproteobacteria bacterium RIFOXYA12_FULL_58_15]OGR10376.1 MAG: hypothetical protein A2341_22840 [Deltaproteobacteria bacterium RIFOXYB12_FULL_58_9]
MYAEAPTTSNPGCVIRITEGHDAGREECLRKGSLIIGKSSDCGMQLSDTTVSGHHLSIEVVPEGLLVIDLGSKNGTFYLETRLERAVLQHGAALRLGRTRLLLASIQPLAGTDYSTRMEYGSIVGSAPSMRRLYAMLERIEGLDYTTLLLGETGVGKEHIAREIHAHSQRSNGPFEICDCASLAPSLIESELFGHERGAFTGAHRDYRGVFERANGGTLFLDEIGELPMDLQPRLLRVLEAHTVRRVGSGETRTVDVRVLAATHRDLTADVHAGKFRQDLFFRLNLVALQIPPLRERREDIPNLIQRFLDDLGQSNWVVSPSTLELFTSGYDWPGNVRELKHAVARVQALGTLPDDLAPSDTEVAKNIGVVGTFREAKVHIINAFERDYLAAKLASCDNNISQAARDSGMERNQFKRLLRKHNLLDNTRE